MPVLPSLPAGGAGPLPVLPSLPAAGAVPLPLASLPAGGAGPLPLPSWLPPLPDAGAGPLSLPPSPPPAPASSPSTITGSGSTAHWKTSPSSLSGRELPGAGHPDRRYFTTSPFLSGRAVNHAALSIPASYTLCLPNRNASGNDTELNFAGSICKIFSEVVFRRDSCSAAAFFGILFRSSRLSSRLPSAVAG